MFNEETVSAILVGKFVRFEGWELPKVMRVTSCRLRVVDKNDPHYHTSVALEFDMGKPDYESFDGWLRECNDDCLVFNVPRGDDIVDTLTLHITPDNEHGVYVRPITRSEIPELLAMYAEEEKVIVSDKLLIDAKISFTHLQITEGRILGAFTKGDILVGSLSLHYLYDLYPGYAHAPYAHLETIVVKEGHRGSGIGSILVSDAVKRCRDMGVTYILAQTKEDNYTMMRVYEKSGLQQSYVNYRIDL